MINKSVKQSPIYSEFSPEELENFFSLKEKKVVPHVDTWYYTVSLYGDCNDPDDNIQAMLDLLKDKKKEKAENYSSAVDLFGLSVENIRFSHYEYCLSVPETFDIFISSFLPNVVTPRIVVQVRTRSLVLDGTMQAICKSFRAVETILDAFGIEVGEVKENRIDYAYHTNLIQDPYRYFSDSLMIRKLKCSMRLYHKVGLLYQKVGKVGKKIDIDYLSLGQRKSNNVFIRIYNKSREVVEKNYKSFFLDKWLEDGLINRYDYEVYARAYELGTYTTGVLIGRIDWYMEHGKNPDIKDELLRLKLSCYEKSDNIDQLRKIVDYYLPPVTLIMNVEFQTKRKFYTDCDEFISIFSTAAAQGLHSDTLELYHKVLVADQTEVREVERHSTVQTTVGKVEFLDEWWKHSPLYRLQILYSLRAEILHYLTSETLCFVDHKGEGEKEKMCNWWKRIHTCTIEEYDSKLLDLFRARERRVDLLKSERRLCSAIAHTSMLVNEGQNKHSTFTEDLSDALCLVNDNDMHDAKEMFDPDIVKALNIEPNEYRSIKARKQRQNKHLFDSKKDES